MSGPLPIAQLSRRALRGALGWPGHLAQTLRTTPAPLPAAALSLEQAAAQAERAPRANTYLALEPGLTRFGTEHSWLSYGAWGSSAMAVGGLQGEDPAELLSGFTDALRSNGYRRALLFPISTEERVGCHEGGFKTLQVGSEALIDLPGFSMDGKARSDLRQMCNRARGRHGITISEIPADEAPESLGPIWQTWLTHRRRGYRLQLLVGTPCFDQPLGRRYFAASQEGRPVAFITITPGWNKQGWGIDVLARHPDAPGGAMDLLLAQTMEILRDEGATVFSLGACPMYLASQQDPDESPALGKTFRFIFESQLGNQIFRFQTLAHYKSKFAPRWEPIYIGGWPNIGPWTLYQGCRMWGLFGQPRLDSASG